MSIGQKQQAFCKASDSRANLGFKVCGKDGSDEVLRPWFELLSKTIRRATTFAPHARAIHPLRPSISSIRYTNPHQSLLPATFASHWKHLPWEFPNFSDRTSRAPPLPDGQLLAMHVAIFTLAVLAVVVNAIPTAKSPSNAPPSGCSTNYPSTFQIVATSVPLKVKKVRSWFYPASRVQEANKFENSVKATLSSLWTIASWQIQREGLVISHPTTSYNLIILHKYASIWPWG
jgi:hypothetical protein